MSRLFLLRHLKSQWNKENRFTGWTDVPLSQEGIESAKNISKGLEGFKIDKVYTSPLARNKKTVSLILESLGIKEIPIVFDKALDERNYGELTGLNKDETIKKYGAEQVHLWRRSYNIAPPKGESLEDVCNRAVPFFKDFAEKDLKLGENVLVVASHNSLRAIVKYVEGISDEDIINVELSFGALVKYEFDDGKYAKFE